MTIETLVCKVDGTQAVEQREVPDDFFVDISAQITELKAQLSASDYKAIKYAEGWISETDYAPIKAERQALRDQINALEATL